MTPPEYIPTNHALDQMARRRISPNEVLEVIKNPEARYANEHRGSETLTGHPNGRFVKVIIAHLSDPPVVITVED